MRMGFPLETGIRMRNMLSISIRLCCRFLRNHPFLVCLLGFLIFLYRWFPSLFGILVYMSPVLVCTAILLGTLLFIGQSNPPEVQKGKKVADVISSFQIGFSEGSPSVIPKRDENTTIIEETSIKVATLVADKVNKVEQDVGLLSYVPVVYKSSLNILHEEQVKEEKEREICEEKSKFKVLPSDTEGVDEDDDMNSGSNDIESSSPDASMADIIPVLDELHPLLDSKGPKHAHLSSAASDIAFENSQKSIDGSIESDEEGTEIQGDDEEEMESGIEDDCKSAIKWTENDQKSLMDLGNLELERNQRLENLVARRRAWRLMNEKNLIDLESIDVSPHITPISTRRNPFDLPEDSYDAMGLPPIPGSAPSLMHPRQNPFDTPYDSNEEKHDPKGDSPLGELPVFNQRDTFFSRHESFAVRPSALGMTKPERQDNYWKPIFVSERMATEGTSYSSFHRQESEVSNSKLSSVPDSESVSSTDQYERISNEQDLPQETESVSTIDHVAGRVECGSQSSEEVDTAERIQEERKNAHHDEVEIVLGGVENHSEVELPDETGGDQIHEEIKINETNLKREVVNDESSSKLSHSSSSEAINNIPDEKQENSANLQQGEKLHLQESGISTEASAESSEVEEHQQREPVYDSSPPAVKKFQSFYSIYFDSSTEFPESIFHPTSAKMTANVIDKRSELHDQEPDEKASGHEEFHAASSQQCMEQGDTDPNQNLDKKGESIQNISTSSVGVRETDDAKSKSHLYISSVTHDSSGTPEFTSPTTGESPKNIGKAKVEQGIPVLEARSAEDIDLAFKQLQEGAEVEEVILPSMIKDQVVSEQSDGNSKANPNLQVIEARSLEDIDSAFELSRDGNRRKMQKSMDLKDGAVEVEANEVGSIHGINTSSNRVGETNDAINKSHLNISSVTHDSSDTPEFTSPTPGESPKNIRKAKVKQGIPVLEARSAEDIDLAFKQLLEGAEVEEVILPSMIKDQLVTEQSNDNSKDNSNLQVVEARSLDDIDIAFELISEGSERKMQNTLDLKDGSVEVEANEVGSIQGLSTPSTIVGETNDAMNKSHLNISSVTHDSSETPEFTSPTTGETPKLIEKVKVEQGIPVLEASSAEDIDLAFKQLYEGAEVEEVILPSMIKDQLVSEQSNNNSNDNSNLQVVEARSLYDIDSAFELISEGSKRKMQQSLDLKDGSVEVEANEVVEFFDVESGNEEMKRIPVDQSESVPTNNSNIEGDSDCKLLSSS